MTSEELTSARQKHTEIVGIHPHNSEEDAKLDLMKRDWFNQYASLCLDQLEAYIKSKPNEQP